jgi:urease accessory protein
MSWHGRLHLRYTAEPLPGGGSRTLAIDRHEGPLRVLQRLYPEGPAVCHHVLVHPPGGIAGGDVLEVDAELAAGTHALLTTPGATRFYRSEGAAAEQRVRLRLAAGARAEWLPLEAIAFDGCIARNHLRFELEPGAQAIAWDVLALGLPAAGKPFVRGSVLQHLEMPGCWLERGRVDAGDTTLLDSPLGWAGHRTLATLVLLAGQPMPDAHREALLEAAREAAAASPLAATAGATSPDARVVLLRALAHRVEPAMQLLGTVRAAWRERAWGLAGAAPRVWQT